MITCPKCAYQFGIGKKEWKWSDRWLDKMLNRVGAWAEGNLDPARVNGWAKKRGVTVEYSTAENGKTRVTRRRHKVT